jgi:zinc/manganese transport system substrate-binding protein
VRHLRASLVASIAAAALYGCGADESSSDAEVQAVATTTHAADITRSVGGDRVSVRSLVPAEADPHDFEPRPSDAQSLAEADLVVRSGGDIDEWLGDLIDSAGGDARSLTLIDEVETLERDGDADPHWWQDPRNAERAVGAVRDALIEADPDGRATYKRNARAYLDRLGLLDAGIATCLERVPADQRKLVTTHDAYEYFARRYGIEVIGALIPSLSSQAQPSAGEVDELVKQIEREDVKAIFPESSLNPELEEAVARETGAAVGRKLWADTLGPGGSGAETYIEAMAADIESMVNGFSGGAVSCRPRA